MRPGLGALVVTFIAFLVCWDGGAENLCLPEVAAPILRVPLRGGHRVHLCTRQIVPGI
jgi:hypothetical protein